MTGIEDVTGGLICTDCGRHMSGEIWFGLGQNRRCYSCENQRLNAAKKTADSTENTFLQESRLASLEARVAAIEERLKREYVST